MNHPFENPEKDSVSTAQTYLNCHCKARDNFSESPIKLLPRRGLIYQEAGLLEKEMSKNIVMYDLFLSFLAHFQS